MRPFLQYTEEQMQDIEYTKMCIQKHEQRFKLIWRDIAAVYNNRRHSHVVRRNGSYESIANMIRDYMYSSRNYTNGEIRATMIEAKSRGWVKEYIDKNGQKRRRLHC